MVGRPSVWSDRSTSRAVLDLYAEYRLTGGYAVRQLSCGMNLTLDGYIAAPGDDLGWSVPSGELFQWWSDRVGRPTWRCTGANFPAGRRFDAPQVSRWTGRGSSRSLSREAKLEVDELAALPWGRAIVLASGAARRRWCTRCRGWPVSSPE